MLVKQAQDIRVGDYLLIVPLGSFVVQARKVTAVEESTAR